MEFKADAGMEEGNLLNIDLNHHKFLMSIIIIMVATIVIIFNDYNAML